MIAPHLAAAHKPDRTNNSAELEAQPGVAHAAQEPSDASAPNDATDAHEADPPRVRHTLSVHDVIQELGEGLRDPGDLSAAMRRMCVDHLTGEGFTNADIARVLRVSARTVTRDREAVRRDGAVAPGLTLGDELLGEFERITLSAIARLICLTRDPKTPAYARLWSEEAITRMYQRLIDTAHRLQYLAPGAARLQHQLDTDPAEQERWRQRQKAGLAKVMGLVRG